MPRSALPFFGACAALLSAFCPPAIAHDARSSSGGASMPDRPELAEVQCANGAESCPRGALLKIRGEYLESARTVVFLGRSGRRDNRQAAPTKRSPHRVVVRVPTAARSGRVRVISRVAGASSVGPRVQVAPAVPPPVATSDAAGAFPIQGAYEFGTQVNRFGGGRGHKGQDVFAACGTPIVAALAGKVTIAKWQDRAGNYVVVKAQDGTSQAYMHLQKAASVGRGEQVTAGQPIGLVGDTGAASGCHLHFELWTAPGWYEGGEPIDPLPSLKQWEQATASA